MTERRLGRRAVPVLEKVSRGQIMGSTEKIRRDIEKGSPDLSWGLGICKVMNIDYEEFYVTLRTLTGSSDEFDRIPVPMSFPGAGNRHFFGAMPEIGDLCYVAWQDQETGTAKSTRTPVIVAWLLPGTWPGREWVTTAGFTEDEYDYSSEKKRGVVQGVHDRIRRKLRHCQPGNIVASSSQGSDLVLDEGVTIANRRGNEIRLRDQDQALIARSLQQFHAMGGARIYGGMVQRDADLLATTMISDGELWDGPLQSSGRVPLPPELIPPDTANPEDFLKPPRPLSRRIKDNNKLGDAVIQVEQHMDPYQILQRGGFVNDEGYVIDSASRYSDAVYGGKAIFRVASSGTENAVLDADKPTLTEYRIEVAHTSDGRLPVTEQTDMFDAERLPPTDPESSGARTTPPPNTPFIEQVLGSVVGNDPYSQEGKLRYGIPLVAIVFDGTSDSPNPRLAPVKLVAVPESGDTPTPIEEHAATLFRLSPPISSGAAPDTFWSVNKKGQLRAAISGPTKENSVEAALRGGLKLSVGGELRLVLEEGLTLGGKKGKTDNVGLNLSSEQGAVRIYGGGVKRGAEDLVQRVTGLGAKEREELSLELEAARSARIQAEFKVLTKAEQIEHNASVAKLLGHQEVRISTAEFLEIGAKHARRNFSGKATDTYSGPKENLPSNGPLHEVTYSPSSTVLGTGYTVQEFIAEAGSLVETFKQGDHSTTVKVGDITWETQSGTATFKAGSNTLELSNSAASLTAGAGDLTLESKKGSTDVTARTWLFLTCTDGLVEAESSVGILLRAPVTGTEQGAILTSGTIEPFTGLPFSTWGLGAQGHLVADSA